MEDASNKKLPVQYAGLSAELKKGDPVLLADGLIRLKVLSTTGEAGGVVLRVELRRSNKFEEGINVQNSSRFASDWAKR